MPPLSPQLCSGTLRIRDLCVIKKKRKIGCLPQKKKHSACIFHSSTKINNRKLSRKTAKNYTSLIIHRRFQEHTLTFSIHSGKKSSPELKNVLKDANILLATKKENPTISCLNGSA